MEEKRDVIKSVGFLIAGIGILLIGIGFIIQRVCSTGKSCLFNRSNVPCMNMKRQCGTPFSSIPQTPPKRRLTEGEIDKTVEYLKGQCLKHLEECAKTTDNEELKKALSDPKLKKTATDFFDSDLYKEQLRKALDEAEFKVVEKTSTIK